jgi:hypothetical protein
LWTGAAGNAHPFVTTDASFAHFGASYARLGGYNDAVDSMYQAVTIPADATSASLRFWYRITSTESAAGAVFDSLDVTVADAEHRGGRWRPSSRSRTRTPRRVGCKPLHSTSPPIAARTVRIVFSATGDGSEITTFNVDDVSLVAPVPGPGRLGNISTRGQVPPATT